MWTSKRILFCVLCIIFKCDLINAEDHLIHYEKDNVQLIVYRENADLKLNVIHSKYSIWSLLASYLLKDIFFVSILGYHVAEVIT